jgi:hypothetical protein
VLVRNIRELAEDGDEGMGANLYCKRLSTGSPGDRLDRAYAEAATGHRGSIDPDLSPVEAARPSPLAC